VIAKKMNFDKLTLALVAVREEGRWAQADAWLNAFLVGRAVGVGSAPDLIGRANSIEGISAVALTAHALVRALPVDALGSKTAHLATLQTFIDICKPDNSQLGTLYE
jgi:hypothetical protein